MSNIPPIEDGYIDDVIKSSGPLKPNLNKTQGIELRALVKLLRDRLESEIAEHYSANQAAISLKADTDQVILKSTLINGKPLFGNVTLDKNDIGLANVDNTTDVDKPLSNLAQTALSLKADVTSLNEGLSTKVDKVLDKQLSTEDFSTVEKNKLTGIQDGATSNESNSYLLSRENHTGSQGLNTITGLNAFLDTKINLNEKGQNNGIATLDGGGKVPLEQISEALLGSVSYQGNYDAATNIPALPAASASKGKYYVVSVAGTQEGLTFQNGDWIISNGSVWQKVDNSSQVTAVNGMTGAVNITNITGNAGSATSWGGRLADLTTLGTETPAFLYGSDAGLTGKAWEAAQVLKWLGIPDEIKTKITTVGTLFIEGAKTSYLIKTIPNGSGPNAIDYLIIQSKNTSQSSYSTVFTIRGSVITVPSLYVTNAPSTFGGNVLRTMDLFSYAGTYTPIFTPGQNISSVDDDGVFHWSRMGNQVTVMGYAAPYITLSGQSVSDFRISLPVSANFPGGAGDAVGSVLYIGEDSATAAGSVRALPQTSDIRVIMPIISSINEYPLYTRVILSFTYSVS